eukprot:4194828-Pyramimonas_sp.AAC.1
MYKETPQLTAIDKRIRGLCTHFRHSVLGNGVLRELQQRHAIPLRTAPGGAGTRWTGRSEQAQWLADNTLVIPIYDVERARRKLKCADIPYGITYGNHQLCTVDWAAVPGLCSLLEPFKEATLLAEAAKCVTGSLVLPLVSSMYVQTSAEAQFHHHATGEVLNNVLVSAFGPHDGPRRDRAAVLRQPRHLQSRGLRPSHCVGSASSVGYVVRGWTPLRVAEALPECPSCPRGGQPSQAAQTTGRVDGIYPGGVQQQRFVYYRYTGSHARQVGPVLELSASAL